MEIYVQKLGNEFAQVSGNQTLTNKNGDTRASISTVSSVSWTDTDRAEYGIYRVDVTPPAGHRWTGQVDNIDGLPVPVFEPVPLAEIAAKKAREIGVDFEATCNAIRSGYTSDEIQSWPQQQAQAEAYNADPGASVPLLAAMAEARGASVSDLVSRILANAAAYSAAYGQALGMRQRRVAQLAAINLDDPKPTTEQIAAAIEAV